MRKALPRDIISLISIACGKAEADICLKNGRIVNVLTGEILSGRCVAIGKDRIAYVGPETNMVGDNTQVIDCNNAYILPGYVDAHCHTDFLHNPRAFTQHVLPMGTTTLMSELTECGALSSKGLDYMLQATEDLPLKFYFSMPSTMPPFPDIEGYDYFPLSVMKEYKGHPRILALSEITSWPRITSLDQNILEKMNFAIEQGLLIEGHLTGCKHNEINALAAAGITSCHESIKADEAKEKLELGLYVMLRHGSVRTDMEELSGLVTNNPHINISRIILTLDWMSPEDMIEHGYMNFLIKSAIKCGIDPISAIQMVTINPATYLGLDREIGSIAPGRKADILVVDNLEEGIPDMVFADGKLLARSGAMCKEAPLPEHSFEGMHPIIWPAGKFKKQDFRISVPDKNAKSINFPVMKIFNKTITKRLDMDIDIKEGAIDPTKEVGIIKASVVHPDGGVITGLVHGFGDDIGGLSASIGVCCNKVVILGNNDHDMAIAGNRMLDLGGGIVLVRDNEIISEIALPIAAVQSKEDIKTLAARMKSMKKELRDLGCRLEEPFFTIHFLTMAGLPFIRILPKGIMDIVKKEILFP